MGQFQDAFVSAANSLPWNFLPPFYSTPTPSYSLLAEPKHIISPLHALPPTIPGSQKLEMKQTYVDSF